MLKQLALATLAATAIVAVTLYLTEKTVLKQFSFATIGSAALMAAVPSANAGARGAAPGGDRAAL